MHAAPQDFPAAPLIFFLNGGSPFT